MKGTVATAEDYDGFPEEGGEAAAGSNDHGRDTSGDQDGELIYLAEESSGESAPDRWARRLPGYVVGLVGANDPEANLADLGLRDLSVKDRRDYYDAVSGFGEDEDSIIPSGLHEDIMGDPDAAELLLEIHTSRAAVDAAVRRGATFDEIEKLEGDLARLVVNIDMSRSVEDEEDF